MKWANAKHSCLMAKSQSMLHKIDKYHSNEAEKLSLLVMYVLLVVPIMFHLSRCRQTEFKCFCINCLLFKWHPSLHFVTITFDNPVSHSIITFIWWILHLSLCSVPETVAQKKLRMPECVFYKLKKNLCR